MWNDGVYIFKDLDSLSEVELNRISQVVSKSRLEKAQKFKRSIDRKNCIVAYLLLLIALQREFKIIGEHTISYGIHGKPYLKEYPNIHFNLSHCSQGVVCAVSRDKIGVDIETIDETRIFFSPDIFSAKELEYIESKQEKDEFFRLWVLKEATVKCIGVGLAYGGNFIEFLSPKDGTFCNGEFVYHLKKIENMYLAVCNKYPVRYKIVTRKELLNI